MALEVVHLPLVTTAASELSTISSAARPGVARGNVLRRSARTTLARRKKRVKERQNITGLGSLTMHGERFGRPGVTDGSLLG